MNTVDFTLVEHIIRCLIKFVSFIQIKQKAYLQGGFDQGRLKSRFCFNFPAYRGCLALHPRSTHLPGGRWDFVVGSFPQPLPPEKEFKYQSFIFCFLPSSPPPPNQSSCHWPSLASLLPPLPPTFVLDPCH